MGNKRPQVLLLGNGINRSFGGCSWNQLLDEMTVRDDLKGKSLSLPMPLQIILRTNNNVKSAMKKNQGALYGYNLDPAHRETLQKILSTGFDHILTTNYSYELESAAFDKAISDTKLTSLMNHSDAVTRSESKLMLHTYNKLKFNKVENKIWHIHGEARKFDSMIIGHYYYASLLCKMKSYSDNLQNSYEKAFDMGDFPEIKSWIDAFILGDIHILGFGFDLSELDLWWLLNRKAAEKAPHGKTYYYEPKKRFLDEKLELLKVLGVEPINCGFEIPYSSGAAIDDNNCQKKEIEAIYMRFYSEAITNIALKMTEE